MSGHHPFSQLTNNFSSQRRSEITQKTNQLLEELTLKELRDSLSLSQEELASKLNVTQPAVSRTENRCDMSVSHLQEIVHAMGGELELTARFGDRIVKISHFD